VFAIYRYILRIPVELAFVWIGCLTIGSLCSSELSAGTAAGTFKLPADLLISIVRNMLVKEYVGPEMKGFDPAGASYTKFLRSIGKRKKIGFSVR
jgi:hypothetical protein